MPSPEGKIEETCNCDGFEKVPCPECFGNPEDIEDCNCDDGEVPCPECT